MDQAPLGFKVPRYGYKLVTKCPVCQSSNMCSLHVLLLCEGVKQIRVQVGIQEFIDECLKLKMSKTDAYDNYLNGKTAEGDDITVQEYSERGSNIKILQETWLEQWG